VAKYHRLAIRGHQPAVKVVWKNPHSHGVSLTPFIFNTFGPLSDFLAHGTVGATARRKLVNQLEGEDEDDFSKYASVSCIADRRFINGYIRNFKRERTTALTRLLPWCSSQ
jgi:hypothetical protein